MAKNENYSASGDPVDFAPNFDETPEPYGNPVPELLDAVKNLPPHTKIIDVAGGYGKYAVPLANMGYDVTIIDLHQPSLDEAKKRSVDRVVGQGSINAIRGDVIREDIPAGSYEVVFCAGFVHHLSREGVADLFDSMVRLLQPGGMLVLDFSTDKDRRHPDGTRILVDGVPEHNTTYAEGISMLTSLYKKHNFRKISLRKVTLCERQDDFWYDANMIVAKGIKE